MSPEPVSVLIADDEEDLRALVRVLLTRAGFDVVAEAIDGEEALDQIARLEPPPVPTVLVLDNRMPGLTGLEVAELVSERVPNQRIVLFSAFLDDDVEKRARAVGIRACVSKTNLARLPEVIAAMADD